MPSSITIVGLGSGGEDQLTLGILKTLEQAELRFARTAEHPAIADLARRGIVFEPFDAIYEAMDDFEQVYEAIADKLIGIALDNDGREVVYAVPGHPMVAERTVQLLRKQAPERGVAVRTLGGESFLDQAFVRLGFDPIEGFQLLDASELSREHLRPRLQTVIGQVYDAFTASDVKLALMNVYPDDHPVVLGQALGVAGEERVLTIPLHELDRQDAYGNLTLVYVPASADDRLRRRSFERLHEIVSILRSPGGCPWDRAQTHASIRKNFIEETFEAIEALDNDDPDNMREEFGDVILQVLLHSQMEEEEGTFDVFDVLAELHDKLIFRHPHVFGGENAQDAEEALRSWEAMKAEEKRRKGVPERQSLLDGIPKDLPALPRAYKIQKKAASVGFDWPDVDGVFDKIEEELAELKQAVKEESPERQKEELGDLLFAAANAARFIKADPEEALAGTNRKFASRFRYIEEQLRIKGRSLDETDLTEMEDLWRSAKRSN
ncbi:nucleoside triphosphate pyrophosphohydrolase [Cohnella lubricantis]|uniref:Nucleoside triphosphate pyrophosphohydrolase n=1 Tax=Cohnella lubricantis TaxID=2163172 RepID=A0A841TIN0_9BACL|nr:nucleoside triphosphate pyrophosphohydrolase [Cohnella lubricantis]MBB6679719.1 nucleoside triphosphate pyrophosphohydrolase [Cohnella lubricantis]MBP2119359.1 tetrapyrrole methylase family protein/MazG family protein [Cohnella lubricantis]